MTAPVAILAKPRISANVWVLFNVRPCLYDFS
jgi:hypothetical protein